LISPVSRWNPRQPYYGSPVFISLRAQKVFLNNRRIEQCLMAADGALQHPGSRQGYCKLIGWQTNSANI
jgi:hypothetical protein